MIYYGLFEKHEILLEDNKTKILDKTGEIERKIREYPNRSLERWKYSVHSWFGEYVLEFTNAFERRCLKRINWLTYTQILELSKILKNGKVEDEDEDNVFETKKFIFRENKDVWKFENIRNEGEKFSIQEIITIVALIKIIYNGFIIKKYNFSFFISIIVIMSFPIFKFVIKMIFEKYKPDMINISQSVIIINESIFKNSKIEKIQITRKKSKNLKIYKCLKIIDKDEKISKYILGLNEFYEKKNSEIKEMNEMYAEIFDSIKKWCEINEIKFEIM